MYKFISIFLALISLGLSNVFGQELSKYDQQGYVSLSLGNGIAAGAGVGILDTVYNQTKIKSPVIQLGTDYMFTDRFSGGLVLAYQRINVTVADSSNQLVEEGPVNRVYFGIRGLWHYGANEKIDLYSGFKFGTVYFSTGEISTALPTKSILEQRNNRQRYSLGIIPIGARFLISDEIGAHFQISIGAPTFISGGINYSF